MPNLADRREARPVRIDPFGSHVTSVARQSSQSSAGQACKGPEQVVEIYNANPKVDAHHGDDPTRRDFIHIAAGAAAVGGVATVVWPLVDQMNPSADTLALASIEFDVSKVVEGQQAVVKWRGKPVFVRHRTAAEIAEAVKDDTAPMKDPQKDADRVKEGKAPGSSWWASAPTSAACRTSRPATTRAGSAPATVRCTTPRAVSGKARPRRTSRCRPTPS